MPDFLLELRSEEIPARMQEKARDDLARLFTEQLAAAGLTATIETHATPRRLALIARDLPDDTAGASEERRGPRADAPAQALEGFLKSTGLARDQLEERTDKKGTFLYAVMYKPGRPTIDVLAEAIPAIVRAFPWPKSMRWGAASLSTESPRWVRPLTGIVALLGERIVPCEVAGIKSGAATLGHRFHHPGIITIGSADDYAAKLRACHVILDSNERAQVIEDGAMAAAAAAGLTLVPDAGLIAENAGLTEWPVPLLGRFDPAFLEVPREVIQLTMRTNQKYFSCTDAAGHLAPAFVCIANIEATDGGAAIVAGNERVLSARLADAKFFWEADLRVPLEEQAKKLGDIVFHEKLGTVADKVERVAKLARWLVEEEIVKSSPARGGGPPAQPVVEGGSEAPLTASARIPNPLHQPAAGPPPHPGEDLATLTERAARLCKADLVTQMVAEFPELQGTIGAHLARAQGEDDQVCNAIRDHYKPVGQGDEVPTAPVTVAVSLADKLDTLMCFFAIGEKPTGSKDPFALRRAALSFIRLVLANKLRFSLDDTFETATDVIASGRRHDEDEVRRQSRNQLDSLLLDEIATGNAGLVWFFADRLKVQQREAGVRHDLIDAVFALGGEDDLVRLLARVHALQKFVETPEGRDLLAGYKRAANILKKEGYAGGEARDDAPLHGDGEIDDNLLFTGEEDPFVMVDDPDVAAAMAALAHPARKQLSYTPEPVEQSLIAALDSAEPQARAAVEAENFEAAMAALAALRGPVDAFFETVMVNDPDPAKRSGRLALLARLRDAVHGVADFSRIEG